MGSAKLRHREKLTPHMALAQPRGRLALEVDPTPRPLAKRLLDAQPSEPLT